MVQSRRRRLLLAASALIAPQFGLAQQAQKIRSVGFLSTAIPGTPHHQRRLDEFRSLMRSIGYEEGKNLAIEWRFAGGKAGYLPVAAQELVRLNVELIVADANEAIAAASQATGTLPIVMWFGVNPTENGWIKSFRLPGGNVTGTTWMDPETFGKILQVLREAVPAAKRIAAMWNPTFPFEHLWREAVIRASQTLAMDLQFFFVKSDEDIRPALEQIAASRPDALFLAVERIMQAKGHEIAAFAVERKLITASSALSVTLDGCLLYYGPQRPALDKRTAAFVDRILQGAKPGEQPVELPTVYELVINAKTARAIGYTVPQSLSARVDRMLD